LNQAYQKEFGFDDICKMDKVIDVVDAFAVQSVGQSG
jgi:hypothetical protein